MINEPTIEQKNEAIGVFMGGQWKTKLIGGRERRWFYYNDLPFARVKNPIDLNYHKSWEELMPVIEKISKLPLLHWDNRVCTDPQDVCYPRTFGMPTEDGKNVMVRFNGFSLHTAPTLIEAAFMAVYEVAEYHNKQKEATNG
jgi:hypothetical protein